MKQEDCVHYSIPNTCIPEEAPVPEPRLKTYGGYDYSHYYEYLHICEDCGKRFKEIRYHYGPQDMGWTI